MFPKFVFVLTILFCHQFCRGVTENVTRQLLAVESNYHFDKILWASGSQSVLRRSQEIRDLFPEDPWIHVCNGYFEVYLLLIKIIMFCYK